MMPKMTTGPRNPTASFLKRFDNKGADILSILLTHPAVSVTPARKKAGSQTARQPEKETLGLVPGKRQDNMIEQMQRL